MYSDSIIGKLLVLNTIIFRVVIFYNYQAQEKNYFLKAQRKSLSFNISVIAIYINSIIIFFKNFEIRKQTKQLKNLKHMKNEFIYSFYKFKWFRVLKVWNI